MAVVACQAGGGHGTNRRRKPPRRVTAKRGHLQKGQQMDSTYTRWTCDRCGTNETMDSGEQPMRWTAITAICPPRAEFGGARQALCRPCTEALSDFMSGAMVGVTA